jgi:Glycine-zipper domain
MNKHALLLPLAVAVVLGGCVTVPTGPTVMVLPGPQKTFDQFQRDGMVCQQFAQQKVAPAGEAAVNNAAASAAVGTALGAAAGAIIGSATGQAGAGAAIGAGTGLLFGSASGGNVAYASSYQIQRSYDVAYMQCMFAHGNQLPGQVVARRPPPPTLNYPPPNFPPPAGVPQGYAPGSYPPGYSPGNYPPPNTPPPAGVGPQG